MRSFPLALAAFPLLLVAACGDGTTTSSGTGAGGGTTTMGTGAGGAPLDPDDFLEAPKSCAYKCPEDDVGCPEKTTPYACPAMGEWKAVAHLETCEAWDG